MFFFSLLFKIKMYKYYDYYTHKECVIPSTLIGRHAIVSSIHEEISNRAHEIHTSFDDQT